MKPILLINIFYEQHGEFKKTFKHIAIDFISYCLNQINYYKKQEKEHKKFKLKQKEFIKDFSKSAVKFLKADIASDH